MTFELIHGDAVEVLAKMAEASVDAVVCDPPYGLEFMGKDWDKFRIDDPGTNRYRGARAGAQGEAGAGDGSHPARGTVAVAYGGGKRPTTSRCTGCGKRDQYRNAHECRDNARWVTEIIDPYAAPPTSLAFHEWVRMWAREAYRVLKPGAHLLAFGGTRTYHRLGCGLEDAGFEIRDCVAWLHGQGFPKSLNVSRVIDEAAGVERPVLSVEKRSDKRGGNYHGAAEQRPPIDWQRTAPATEAAREWDGWGTAIKPAMEPVVLARKPLAGTVVANVLEHGTGALNIDACMIGTETLPAAVRGVSQLGTFEGADGNLTPERVGRWPANVVLSHGDGCRQVGTRKVKTGTAVKRRGSDPKRSKDWLFGSIGRAEPGTPDATKAGPDGTETIEAWECEPDCPVRVLDQQSGESSTPATVSRGRSRTGNSYSIGKLDEPVRLPGQGDTGGASRFFYTAKPASGERHYAGRNSHPTIKPVTLMRWLVRLVTPRGGLVVDPFMGSGTTGIAALAEGFRFIGIERDAEYLDIARKRIAGPLFAQEEPTA